MEIIVSDFDGTITLEDSLYKFFQTYAKDTWLDVERMWCQGVIGSKECLEREFELVENLDKELIDEYISTLEIDPYFSEFIQKNNRDFMIVSDGVDYFINKILEKNNIENIKVISNHGEFSEGKFKLSFNSENNKCKNKSGTCKCRAINELRKKYDKIIYIGDGQSDFCAADKADILYAKESLLNYCRKNNINCRAFESFKDLI